MKSKLINKFTIVKSDWARDNAPPVYSFFLKDLRDYQNNPMEFIDDEDVRQYESGQWLIEFFFDKDKVFCFLAPDAYLLENQPTDCKIFKWEDIKSYMPNLASQLK